MNLKNRSYQQELLDADDIAFEAIQKNMYELNFINTYLGGHLITINGFKQLLGNKKEILVCEIGCGGGDNLAAIKKWCNQKNIRVQFIGIDIKEDCINIAKQNPFLQHITHWIVSDYATVTFTQMPDIIFSSLFCHHFTDPQLVQQLHWMKSNSTIGFFINDLHRHWLAYKSIQLLTQLFSTSYLVKYDAPLSVARGFKKNEWKIIFTLATINSYTIQWQWAFRYLITYKHD